MRTSDCVFVNPHSPPPALPIKYNPLLRRWSMNEYTYSTLIYQGITRAHLRTPLRVKTPTRRMRWGNWRILLYGILHSKGLRWGNWRIGLEDRVKQGQY